MDDLKLDTYRGIDMPGLGRRRIDVWVPQEYSSSPNKHYPVLYMQDGQNLFKAKPRIGKGWEVPTNVQSLSQSGKIYAPIVVGITSTLNRMGDYMPQKPMQSEAALRYLEDHLRQINFGMPGGLRSDIYLRWLVEKVKPLIDEKYRTLTDPQNTVLMGSSMGGLISLYGLCEYPDVFGGAGCLSTHWPIGGDYLLEWFSENLPKPGLHKLYFDHGDQDLDQAYGPWQKKMDAIIEATGYSAGKDWLSLIFEGQGHAERFWAGRLQIPLEFFFSAETRGAL